MIEDLEKTVAQFKQQLQESEYRRQQQVRVSLTRVLGGLIST